MPAGQYFKLAASNLQSAIVELRRDIDNRRRLITEREKEVQKRKDELTRNRTIKESHSGSDNMDTANRAQLLKSAQDDVGEISKIEAAFAMERTQILQEISNIESNIIDISNQAKYFESRQNE